MKWYYGKQIQIPEDWKIKPLSEVAKVIDSRHFTPKYTDDGYQLILPNNITTSGLDLSETKFTSKEDYEVLIDGNRKPEKNDIIYTRNASFGVANQVKSEQLFSLGQDLVLIKASSINPYLLFAILNSAAVAKQLNRLVSGSTFKRINLEFIHAFSILYPNNPKEESRIASILTNVDDSIQQTSQLIEKTKQLKTGLMQKLLTKGIGHTKFKKVKDEFRRVIKIPDEWIQDNLGNLVEILDGQRIPLEESVRSEKQGKYPYYGASGIIDYINDYIFDERLLCLAEDGENLRSRVLPIAFTIHGKTWVNNHAHVLRPKEKISHGFLHYFLNYKPLLKYIASTAQPKLNQKDMKTIQVIFPKDKTEQQKIVSILSNTDSQIESLESKKSQLQKTKQGLMQKLLTGQIRVPLN